MGEAATRRAREEGGTPKIAYQRLAQELRRELGEGAYSDGRQMPTEAELGATHGVGRQTVRRALQDLVAEGLIYRIRGRGTFAIQSTGGGRQLRSFGSIDDLLAVPATARLELISDFEPRVDAEAAAQLRQPSDDIYSGLFRRLDEDGPFLLTRIDLPTEVGLALAGSLELPRDGQAAGGTIVALIDGLLPRPIVGAHQTITVCPMPAGHAAAIELDPDTPVTRIDRLYFDSDGVPVELATSYANPDRYSYRVELRRTVGADSH